MFNLTSREYANQIELWHDVVGYEGLYQVSNLGHVKRIKTYKHVTVISLVKSRLNQNGYPIVKLYRKGEFKMYFVHRLVAFAFLGNPPTPKHTQVNHINSNPSDPRLENLEWVTPLENVKHSAKYGYGPRNGERASCVKLKQWQVDEIRTLVKTGVKQSELAKRFGVARSTVNMIVKGKNWK